MKRCIVDIRRPGGPESPSGKDVPTVCFPSMATMAAVMRLLGEIEALVAEVQA